jgi:hypothetical protein
VDVHPAHYPLRTWRDFFLQLLMITIGLFIALTLQAGVESLHHRHLVRDARESLRREIEANQRRYAENVRNLENNRLQLARDIDQLRNLRSGKPIEKKALAWGWDWKSFADASWKTAQVSGAVSYMSPDLINAYTDVYDQQGYVNSEVLATFNDEARSAAPLRVALDPAALTPSDIQAMLISLAESDIKLATLQNIMKSLEDLYAEALRRP